VPSPLSIFSSSKGLTPRSPARVSSVTLGKFNMSIFDFFKPKIRFDRQVSIRGGDGTTEITAVIIDTSNNIIGIDAEYKWLSSSFGVENQDWRVLDRMTVRGQNDKPHDVFALRLADGSTRQVYFDISAFHGRF
jgi:hypothetical protein